MGSSTLARFVGRSRATSQIPPARSEAQQGLQYAKRKDPPQVGVHLTGCGTGGVTYLGQVPLGPIFFSA